MEFQVKIEQKWISSIKFTINFRRLNIKIHKTEEIPGPIPSGDPDTELTLKLLSDNPAEIFFLGFYSGQERISFTLK